VAVAISTNHIRPASGDPESRWLPCQGLRTRNRRRLVERAAGGPPNWTTDPPRWSWRIKPAITANRQRFDQLRQGPRFRSFENRPTTGVIWAPRLRAQATSRHEKQKIKPRRPSCNGLAYPASTQPVPSSSCCRRVFRPVPGWLCKDGRSERASVGQHKRPPGQGIAAESNSAGSANNLVHQLRLTGSDTERRSRVKRRQQGQHDHDSRTPRWRASDSSAGA